MLQEMVKMMWLSFAKNDIMHSGQEQDPRVNSNPFPPLNIQTHDLVALPGPTRR